LASLIAIIVKIIFELLKWVFSDGHKYDTAQESSDNCQLTDSLRDTVRRYQLRYGVPDDLRARRDPGAPAPVHQRR
jgi:hypothetical protein